MAVTRLGRTGLTARAAAFLAAGAIMIGAGLRAGWTPVTQIGIVLSTLPLVSLATVMVRRDKVSASRTVPANWPQLGDPISVVLAVAPRGGGLGPIMVVDSAPAILGGTHVAVISGTSRQHTSRHGFNLVAARRGTHQLGPANMYLTDRLGLVARGRQIVGTTPVTVVPRIHQLTAGIPAGATSGPGWGTSGAPGGSHDDVIPRDYRPGDELRRMDWPATARSGMLMVRGEEQPWRACLLVVLDRRTSSHRGPVGADSFETALSMVASVGSMALADGWDLKVVDVEGSVIFASHPSLHPQRNTDLLSQSLAHLETTDGTGRSGSLTTHLPEDSPVLAVLGADGLETSVALAQLLASARPAMAAVIAAQTWEDDSLYLSGSSHLNGSEAKQTSHGSDLRAQQAAGILRRSGWLAAVLTASTPIPDVWDQLRATASTGDEARTSPISAVSRSA